MTPFLTEVTTSLVCVVSMAEALLRRWWRGSDRTRYETGGVASMACTKAGASIGVRGKPRQRWAKRMSWALRIARATLFVLAAARARAAAPAGGGRWLLASTPLTASGHGTRDTRVWLPPSYDRPEAASRRYPVVVFLHGWPG